MPEHICRQHIGHGFDGLAQVQGDAVKHAFGDIANDIDLQDGEVFDAGFLHDGLFRCARKFSLCPVHSLSRVHHGFIQVMIRIEFHHYGGGAFGGESGHFLDPFHVADFNFQGLDQQTFGVFWRYAFVHHSNDKEGDVDVRFTGNRYRRTGDQTGQNDHEHQWYRRPRTIDGGFYERVHGAGLVCGCAGMHGHRRVACLCAWICARLLGRIGGLCL